MPRKKIARIAAIQPSVVAAFRELGALNALTPFEIASVPVIADAAFGEAAQDAER